MTGVETLYSMTGKEEEGGSIKVCTDIGAYSKALWCIKTFNCITDSLIVEVGEGVDVMAACQVGSFGAS